MELAKLILEYIEVLIWPVTLLILLLTYRKELASLFSRAKRLELPGGLSIEVFEKQIQEAKDLAREVVKEEKKPMQRSIDRSLPKVEDSEANKRMVELGLNPSPSGLKIAYYQDLAAQDPRLALAGLRIDLELMLKNLATGFGIQLQEKESNLKINRKLLEGGAITTAQFQLINKLLDIVNAAIHGVEVSEFQANEVFKIMDTLIKDYKAWLFDEFAK